MSIDTHWFARSNSMVFPGGEKRPVVEADLRDPGLQEPGLGGELSVPHCRKTTRFRVGKERTSL